MSIADYGRWVLLSKDTDSPQTRLFRAVVRWALVSLILYGVSLMISIIAGGSQLLLFCASICLGSILTSFYVMWMIIFTFSNPIPEESALSVKQLLSYLFTLLLLVPPNRIIAHPHAA